MLLKKLNCQDNFEKEAYFPSSFYLRRELAADPVRTREKSLVRFLHAFGCASESAFPTFLKITLHFISSSILFTNKVKNYWLQA